MDEMVDFAGSRSALCLGFEQMWRAVGVLGLQPYALSDGQHCSRF
jgi:hypothetical protein